MNKATDQPPLSISAEREPPDAGCDGIDPALLRSRRMLQIGPRTDAKLGEEPAQLLKKRRQAPKPNFEELIPLLISLWRRLHKVKGGPPESLQTREFREAVDAIVHLNQGLERTQELIGKDYFKDKRLLGAYLLYHWLLHYAQGLSLLEELPNPPRKVLDLCSGAAPFALAALQHGAEEIIAVDQNQDALQLGAEICGKSGHTLTIRPWKADPAGVLNKLPVDGSFDLIIMGYCLGELHPETHSGWFEHQNDFISSLLNRLSPDGFLLLVENSWPNANKRLLRIRDHFVKQGVPIQAPCVWKGQCPALQTAKSPCYAQRPFKKPYLISELQRACGINLGSLKMSYLILKSPRSGWPLLQKEGLYRIISPPIEAIHGKRYYLCGTDGKKSLGSRLKVHPSESRAFEYLQRGDLISIENSLNSGDSMDIIKDTKVSIKAACGKALPEGHCCIDNH